MRGDRTKGCASRIHDAQRLNEHAALFMTLPHLTRIGRLSASDRIRVEAI